MYKTPQELLDYFRKFIWFDKSKIIIDQSDGLWIYDGDIDFSNNKDFVEFPEWFINFKEIRGYFDCSWTPITSFKGLENLKEIGEGLDCAETSITDFTGLNNLKSIGTYLYCYRTPIKSFKGLENLRIIGTYLDCRETSITNFTGLENLTKIGEWFNCRGTSITSFKGLEQCELNPDIIYSVEIREIYKEWKKSKQIQEIAHQLTV